MDALIGVLIDVSGSMQTPYKSTRLDQKHRKWSSIALDVIKNLAKTKNENINLFTILFGLKATTNPVDAVYFIEKLKQLPLNIPNISQTRLLPFSPVSYYDSYKDYKVQNQVQRAIIKAKQLIHPSRISVYKPQKVLQIFQNMEKKKKTEQQMQQILTKYIYGSTPLVQALQASLNIFSKTTKTKKLLIIVSDGLPNQIPSKQLMSKIEQEDITICGLWISTDRMQDCLRIYSPNTLKQKYKADRGIQCLGVQLSSTIATESLPSRIITSRGWSVDCSQGVSSLFFQVNSPQVINSATKMIQNLTLNADALINSFEDINLDLYINGVPYHKKQILNQQGGTCYANALSTIISLTARRIIDRDGGYPQYLKLRQQIIQFNVAKKKQKGKSGPNLQNGGKCSQLLDDLKTKYRYQWKKISEDEAKECLFRKRPVLVTFVLDQKQWYNFSQFFINNKTSTFAQDDLCKPRKKQQLVGSTSGGHAVVLVNLGPNYMRLMNSWGDKWADNGFFKIKNGKALGKNVEFYDVYWTLNMLSTKQKRNYRENCQKYLQNYFRSHQEYLNLLYECPICHKKSYCREFGGTLSNGQCPKCNKEFAIEKTSSLKIYKNMALKFGHN